MYLFELVLFFGKILRSGIVRLYDGITRWQGRSMYANLLLQELQNYNSLLNTHRQESVGFHRKRYPMFKGKGEAPERW